MNKDKEKEFINRYVEKEKDLIFSENFLIFKRLKRKIKIKRRNYQKMLKNFLIKLRTYLKF